MDGPEFDAGMDTRAGTPQVRNGTREGPQSPARPPIGMIWPCPTGEQTPSHRQKRLQPLEVQSQASLRRWWEEMGKSRYPEARELFITADAGGSNGYRSRVWKHELQQLADEMGVCIHVSHFPPGTSKWNKIEHRVFCHITQNWRGKPLRTFETIVDLIGNTRTNAGLRVKAELDKRKYPAGVAKTDAEMDALSLHRNEFRGDWNHELRPR